MDFVCFTESVGDCEEDNMMHKVVLTLHSSLDVARILIPSGSVPFLSVLLNNTPEVSCIQRRN